MGDCSRSLGIHSVGCSGGRALGWQDVRRLVAVKRKLSFLSAEPTKKSRTAQQVVPRFFLTPD